MVALSQLRSWSLTRWLVAAAAAILGALVTGVPTGIVETPIYHRMTPVTWWDYPIWVVSAATMGLIAATYLQARPPSDSPESSQQLGPGGRRSFSATILTVFAVGCPICNKLVVVLLGVSGALNYFAPIQPFLGISSIALLLFGLTVRLRTSVACALPPRAPAPQLAGVHAPDSE